MPYVSFYKCIPDAIERIHLREVSGMKAEELQDVWGDSGKRE